MRQGDPLSPSLFIIASEVLSRGLNHLIYSKQVHSFSMPRNCPPISHLAFADDVIIFTNGSKNSLCKLMAFLSQYENESGHKINKQKSCFLLGDKAPTSRASIVAECTGFVQKSFPINYLGCNLYVGRKKFQFFEDMVFKVEKKLAGWKGRLLSPGGRLILIKHVLQVLSIHVLAAQNPHKSVFRKINSLVANFFWGQGEDGFKYHWVRWGQCTLPIQEGGLGIRRIEDISDAFAIKAWWLLKSANSLWASYMRCKYAKQIFSSAQMCYGSAAWKRMNKVMLLADVHIAWIIGEGNVNFWYDKWFGDIRIADIILPLQIFVLFQLSRSY